MSIPQRQQEPAAMNTLAEIENAVSKFRDWFDALKNKKWDQEFEANAANGLLDSLADEALSDFNSGRCKEL
jgi:hypothetical protein